MTLRVLIVDDEPLARRGLRVQSVPINYRRRIGRSKVTGTFRGTILATYYMFLVPLKYLFIKS